MCFKWKTLALYLVLLVILALSLVMIGNSAARAAQHVTYSNWVMCQQDSWVNIRSGPGVNHEVVGYVYPMDELICDAVTKSGWVHVVNPPCDAQEGYVFVGYLTVVEPTEYDGQVMRVDADGRVAVRNNMCGDRVMWIQPGSEVEVYQMSEEWAVCSVGFIRAKYLVEVN